MKKIINHWITYKSKLAPFDPRHDITRSQYYKLAFEYFLYQKHRGVWNKLFIGSAKNQFGGHVEQPNFSNLKSV